MKQKILEHLRKELWVVENDPLDGPMSAVIAKAHQLKEMIADIEKMEEEAGDETQDRKS